MFLNFPHCQEKKKYTDKLHFLNKNNEIWKVCVLLLIGLCKNVFDKSNSIQVIFTEPAREICHFYFLWRYVYFLFILLVNVSQILSSKNDTLLVPL